ncbi:DUF4248 domain-containing protein [Bacteroidaceae bacterium]|jgi:hypothetical protein|nr:DUF4248 domain-containing protein [Bacteroides sp.]
MTQETKASAQKEEQSKLTKGNEVGKGKKKQGTIGKGELAMEIYPEMTPGSALNALRRDINANPELQEDLAKTAYKPNCHVLTYKQEQIIRKHIYGTSDDGE